MEINSISSVLKCAKNLNDEKMWISVPSGFFGFFLILWWKIEKEKKRREKQKIQIVHHCCTNRECDNDAKRNDFSRRKFNLHSTEKHKHTTKYGFISLFIGRFDDAVHECSARK